MKVKNELSAYYKANSFPVKVSKDYFKFSSKSEIIFDLVIPLVLSVIFSLIVVSDKILLKDILNSFVVINGHVVTAISILAGFNFASISLLASSNSDTISLLKKTSSKEHSTSKREVTLFDMLLIFFSWAIIVQILVIGFIIILLFLISFAKINWDFSGHGRLVFKVVVSIWLALIIHSLLVTIRNVKNMYYFMKYTPKSNKD